jgi:hypothetical protein
LDYNGGFYEYNTIWGQFKLILFNCIQSVSNTVQTAFVVEVQLQNPVTVVRIATSSGLINDIGITVDFQ